MNIIFCSSPLQVLVAREVIRYFDEDFFGIYQQASTDPRQKHYQELLDSVCNAGSFHIKPKTAESSSEDIYSALEGKQFKKFFYASLDNPNALQIARDLNLLDSLYSFDDGSTSVFEASMFSLDRELAHGFTMQQIRSIIKKHFTVFDVCRLFPKEKQVKLELHTEPAGFARAKNGKKVKVLLGQALGSGDQESLEKSKEYAEAAIAKYGIDYFYPHPRMHWQIPGKTRNTKLCFEEAIYELLAEYEFVDVFHFWSTSALTVQKLPGVAIHGFDTALSHFGTYEMRKLGFTYERLELEAE